MVPLETVLLTSRTSFGDAVEEGRQNLLDVDDFDSLLESIVRRADRSGTPHHTPADPEGKRHERSEAQRSCPAAYHRGRVDPAVTGPDLHGRLMEDLKAPLVRRRGRLIGLADGKGLVRLIQQEDGLLVWHLLGRWGGAPVRGDCEGGEREEGLNLLAKSWRSIVTTC